ncbi:MAG: hypothetical protein C4517_15620 [Stygiobacter sp.]|nr:MAG: hypothetical protein C4517_15620 [Stygiobacter sp.]
MAAYFQMGHDTENLIGEKGLELFKGIILSPLNRNPDELHRYIKLFRGKGTYDIVFDPQLYFPRSKRGDLKSHPYYPKDFETADLSDISWWSSVIDKLVKYVNVLEIDTICSPVFLTRSWREDYYLMSVKIKDLLNSQIKKINPQKKCFLTIVIDVKDLTDKEKILKTASIVSSTESDGYYLVFLNDINPRKETSKDDLLFGMMSFVRELKATGKPIIVSHCSSDLLLYKYAGADHCATGKFFNLRRFTESRFEDSSSGGGQLPYWFEHGLIAFLREPDLLRILENRLDIINIDSSNNCWSKIILENIKSTKHNPWIKYGWRHYLASFSLMEEELTKNPLLVEDWILRAQENWNQIVATRSYPEEPDNNGAWLAIWKQTIDNYKKNTI